MRSVVIGIDDSDAAAVRSPRSRQVSGRIRPRSRVGAAQYRGSVSDRPPGLDNYPGWCGTRERLKCLMRAARTTAIPIHAAAISARARAETAGQRDDAAHPATLRIHHNIAAVGQGS